MPDSWSEAQTRSEINYIHRKDHRQKGADMKKLFKLGIFAAMVGGIVKLVSTQKAEWQGLTEPEVRDKLHTKLDTKMPSEKVDELGDKAVEWMRDRGVLGEETPGEV